MPFVTGDDGEQIYLTDDEMGYNRVFTAHVKRFIDGWGVLLVLGGLFLFLFYKKR